MKWADMLCNPIQLVNYGYYNELKRFYLTVRNLHSSVLAYCTEFSYENRHFRHSDLFFIMKHIIVKLNDRSFFERVVETLSFLSYDYITIKKSHFDFGELLALAAENNRKEIVEYIIDLARKKKITIDDKDYLKVLSRSPKSKNYQLFTMLSEFVDISSVLPTKKAKANILLECYKNAVRSGSKECVQWYIDHCKWNALSCPVAQAELMVCAEQSNSLEMIKWLHKTKKCKFFRLRSLWHFFRVKRIDVIEWIYNSEVERLENKEFDHDAIFNDDKMWESGPNLERLVDTGYLEGLKFLFEKGAQLGDKIWENVIRSSDVEIAKWLLEIGRPIDVNNPIDLATSTGNFGMVKWLQSIRPDGCESALELAISGDFLEIVQWLYENRTERYPLALDCAAQHNNIEIVEWLRTNDDQLLNPTTTAISKTIQNRYFDMVKFLYLNYPESFQQMTVDEMNRDLKFLALNDQMDLFLIFIKMLGDKANIEEAVRYAVIFHGYKISSLYLDMIPPSVLAYEYWRKVISIGDLETLKSATEKLGRHQLLLSITSYFRDIKIWDYFITNHGFKASPIFSYEKCEPIVYLLFKSRQFHLIIHVLQHVPDHRSFKINEQLADCKLGRHSIPIFKLFTTHRERALQRLKEEAFINNQI
ncbi:hypothetical protein PPL_02505 [Heterostelium album PN500]|uniref:Ankyrin repeat protein n=1 Tax=Heterostelium pallidum (strain ATCC 26659 / Pp 5 / PN500) TaxID=670386 RepID=D3B296_HETP5|nr:hypothetical protein PPL_02505 [Heterostelium album PN500]EFA84471.1 hypothetical protein PPL_02505 [Heterostelium album PN500]|eukprot:XP_020436585.1 hypothetical protein PPL_02505 [Heterostelium album PN500]